MAMGGREPGSSAAGANSRVPQATSPATRRRSRWHTLLLTGLLELLLVLGVYSLYRAGRVLAMGNEAEALDNGAAIHSLEAALNLPSEAHLQGLVPSVDFLELANYYYVSMHFPVAIAFLVWGLLRRPRAEYVWARNLMIVQTSLAVLIHILFPLAPPRMFSQFGFVDTMTVYGPSAYDGASGALANQYAAMPSLHVGWAVLIAVVVVRCGPALMRWLAVAHALITAVVVTVTANHWYVDGVVAVGLLGLALVLFPAPGRSRLPAFRRSDADA